MFQKKELECRRVRRLGKLGNSERAVQIFSFSNVAKLSNQSTMVSMN